MTAGSTRGEQQAMPVLRVRAPLRPAGHGPSVRGHRRSGNAVAWRATGSTPRPWWPGPPPAPRRGARSRADPPSRNVRRCGRTAGPARSALFGCAAFAERVIGPDAVRVRHDGRCAHRHAGSGRWRRCARCAARIAAQEHRHGLRGADQRLRGIRTGQGRQAHRYRFTGCQHALARAVRPPARRAPVSPWWTGR